MKVVILAGGRGTRLSEETHLRPKPMVEIGGRPILWHIMKIYAAHGLTDFILCLGYRGYMIKEYFYNYFLHQADVTIDMARNTVEYHNSRSEPWRVTLVDTGESTETGGRVKRIAPYLGNDDAFCLTYGDGVANVDITREIAFHHARNVDVTMTTVRPPARFGSVAMDNGLVSAFIEKPQAHEGFINGGFFVVSQRALSFIDGDSTSWEYVSLDRITKAGRLGAFCHEGFWQAMDNIREKEYLEELWQSGRAPWKVWN